MEKKAREGAPWPIENFSRSVLKPEQTLKHQLPRLGLHPEDLDGNWLSHLDHTSGLQDLTDARSFHASRPEIDETKFHLLRYQKDTFNMVDLQPFDYEKTGEGPKGKSYGVFQDDSVQLISTPGHTDGLFTVKCQDKDGHFILLSRDTVYLQNSIRDGILPDCCRSTKDAAESVRWLKEQQADPNCLLIVPSHDPSIQPQTIELDESGHREPVFTLHEPVTEIV